ncbi:hypothetical protein FA15DRAFT_597519 [Coprinopsis marcescibilis]|uniref:Fungal pheromone STE3G-protein-coupled receptor n=1 Tax=Coprinopsis marcescibilis TaxID=230819 RepID=A0A5C3KMG7_COPMA|nr:hypothetical protein FA15DRAFT_597519 [Coprinopsis marcescibilis]
MSPAVTNDSHEYGLVLAKSIFANYIVTIFSVGILFFMTLHSLVVFLETPLHAREGRARYMVTGCLIFIFYALMASLDMSIPFDILLETSNGAEYTSRMTAHTDWREILSTAALSVVFTLGDGLLVYRCILMLYGRWIWLALLPVLTYFATIGEFEREPVPNSVESARCFLNVATNVLLTSIIASRIMATHRQLAKSLPAKHLAIYPTAVRILIESALPLSVAGVVQGAVILASTPWAEYKGDRNAAVAALGATSLVYYALLAISPQIIIFRVTIGRSWTRTLNSTDAVVISRPLAFNHESESELEESHVPGSFLNGHEGTAIP